MPYEDESFPIGFEWDTNKNVTNVLKHGIDFLDAVKVFADPDLVVIGTKVRQQEARLLAIGLLEGLLITVVFTLRGDRIRIISARRARPSERRRYGN